MEDSFEALITSYIATKVGMVENFIGTSLSKHLTDTILALHQKELLIPAGVGNIQKLQHNQLIRKDIIYWLDRKNNNIYVFIHNYFTPGKIKGKRMGEELEA